MENRAAKRCVNAGSSFPRTYFREFGGETRDHLFVAFATPNDKQPALSYHIRYMERKWLHDFVQAQIREAIS